MAAAWQPRDGDRGQGDTADTLALACRWHGSYMQSPTQADKDVNRVDEEQQR